MMREDPIGMKLIIEKIYEFATKALCICEILLHFHEISYNSPINSFFMKKFLILLLLTSSVALSTIPYLEAADEVLVTVTEKIPGADCKCIVD
jgi:hypothetical protein